MGDVEISFVDYSDSKKIHLKSDIVEYARMARRRCMI
jgi:hypothetical protein